jgi:uncharacterized alkaline shock family protein YloU
VAHRVLLVVKVLLEQLEHKVQVDQQEPRVLSDLRVILEHKAQVDPAARKVFKVILDQLVAKVQVDHKVLRVLVDQVAQVLKQKLFMPGVMSQPEPTPLT